MDQLLIKKKVTRSDIKSLAEKIANFHKRTEIIYKKEVLKIREDFNDLEDQKEFLSEQLGDKYKKIINHAIKVSDSFIEKNKDLLAARLRDVFYRDCHGDLHSRNIFLLPAPVPFDCIEFNDDFCQIDVLNEVAFLCMDLDAFNRKDLSDLFIEDYNPFFPAIKQVKTIGFLFIIKAAGQTCAQKLTACVRNQQVIKKIKQRHWFAAAKYLDLMDNYLKAF